MNLRSIAPDWCSDEKADQLCVVNPQNWLIYSFGIDTGLPAFKSEITFSSADTL